MEEQVITSIKKSHKKRWLFILLAVALAASIVVAMLYLSRDKKPTGYVWPNETVQYSTETPSEQKLASDFNWKGNANEPKKITIEKQGIDGFVQKVGVDQNKQVAVPNNIHVAGWFTDSVRPGDKGLSIIDGHVNGRVSDTGIFKQLPKVAVDDIITIMFGDNSTKKFKVFAAEEVKTEDSASVFFSQNPTIANQLNLITCVGNYVDANGTYDKRFIVQAELIQ